MLPTVSVSPTSSYRTKQHLIKIKSPKSEIKVHKINLTATTNISPELPSKGSSSIVFNDEVDKITQCWNNLKVTALSKAIAMSPDVGDCSIGPKSSTSDLEAVTQEDVECDLSRAVTSTPVKPRLFDHNTGSQHISQTKKSLSPLLSDDESSKLETLRIICLNKIEEYINNQAQRKRDLILKSWEAHDEKMRKMSLALKNELYNERILRIQEQNIAVQKLIMENESNAMMKAQEQQEQIKVDHEKRIAETGEKLRQLDQKRKEVEEKRKKRDELKRIIDGIYVMHVSYNQKYCQIHEMNKSCNNIQLLSEQVSDEVPKLKAMNEVMLKLVEKSNAGKVSIQDLKTAEELVKQISYISQVFAKYIDEINKSLEKAEEEKNKEHLEKDLKAKQEEVVQEKSIKEIEQSIENEKSRPQSPSKLAFDVEDCISYECLNWYLELNTFLEDYEKKLEPLVTDDSFKKFRFDCQKMVNIPVNAISPLDDTHLQDKLYKLSRLLKGLAAPLGNSLFLATEHPLGLSFCTNLLAKKFVKQGEHTVSSKPEAAFAIAAVIVALWVDFPDFGRLLLAHFHRECPYLIPAFFPQVEGQSNEDYYKLLGYEYSEEGKVEEQDKFLRRMSGVMRLYAAILITPLRRSQIEGGKEHPHNIKEAWRWITATLNMSPRPDISPTILFDFLEVTGEMMYKTYRVQFTKLLQFLCTDYVPKIEQVTPDGCGGPVSRLKSFLEKILREGKVPPPTGLLPPNFW